LRYDGKHYYLYEKDGEKLIKVVYKYLKRFEETPANESATYTHRLMYVLVNDNETTWDDIIHGMFSSQWGDYIDHRVVYSLYTYK
jgi:hypothetical protein